VWKYVRDLENYRDHGDLAPAAKNLISEGGLPREYFEKVGRALLKISVDVHTKRDAQILAARRAGMTMGELGTRSN
jgi:hypothetical protein